MGKYIKSFSGHTDYQTFIRGWSETTFVRPNVSYCEIENEAHYNKQLIESLSSILTLGDNPSSAEWHPTEDELEYIQEEFNTIATIQCDVRSRTLYVSKTSEGWSVSGLGEGWGFDVSDELKIGGFYQSIA